MQTPAPDPLMLELRRLCSVIEDLRDEQRWLARRMLKRDDSRTGAAILPLALEVHGEDFAPAELLAAALNDRTAVGQALLELVREYMDEDGEGCRTLAWFFIRIEGVVLGGHRLVKVDDCRARAGTRYRVQVVG